MNPPKEERTIAAGMRLGVNVDHVATVRQARGTPDPDPVQAALQAEKGGADSIVCHLREDRRHIQDADLHRLRKEITTRLNLEMAASAEIIAIALAVKPDQVTLVPERREERTTEGGLDVAADVARFREIFARFNESGIEVSFFVEADEKQIRASHDAGARIVEIHTGHYADGHPGELPRIERAAKLAKELGLSVAAGHGLNLANVAPIARIPEIEELNIGHSIVGRAILVGIERAVAEMKEAMRRARTREG